MPLQVLPHLSEPLQNSRVVSSYCCRQILPSHFLLRVSNQNIAPMTQKTGASKLFNPMVNCSFSPYFTHQQQLWQTGTSPSAQNTSLDHSTLSVTLSHWLLVLLVILTSNCAESWDSNLSSPLFCVYIYGWRTYLVSWLKKFLKKTVFTQTEPTFLTTSCI